MSSSDPFIFIIGPGRSGTTLLRSLLSAHPRISIAPETHFIKQARNASRPGSDRLRDFDQFWKDYTRSTRFTDLDVSPERCRELMDDPHNPTHASIFRAMLLAYGERVGKQRVGEKTPEHTRFLPELTQWFADSQFIVIERDPRAVVASQLKTPWVERRLEMHGVAGTRRYQIAAYANGWSEFYEDILPRWKNDPRFLTLSYEQLVKDDEGQLRTICDFLGEPFTPEMITNRSAESVPLPAGTDVINEERWRTWRHEHHAQTLRPVSADSLEKWRSQLTDSEVALIEGCCWDGMIAAGYDPVTPEAEARQAWSKAQLLRHAGNLETQGRARLYQARNRARHILKRLSGR